MRREGARQKNKRRREKDPNRKEQKRSGDEESRCSLYPPATSLILAMKEQNAEEKSRKKEEDVHYQTTLLLSLHFTLFSFIISLPRSLISLRAGLQKAEHARQFKAPKMDNAAKGYAELSGLVDDLISLIFL